MPVDVPVRQPDGVDVQLVRGAVISGALIDELGEPVSSTSATIRAVSDTGDITHARIVAVGQTDDLGQFRVSGLAAGSYILEATPGLMRTMSEDALSMQAYTDGRRMRDQIFYPGVTDPAAAQRLTLQAGDERAGLVMMVPAVPPFLSSPLNRPAVGPDGRPDPNAMAIVKGRVTRPDGSPRSRRASERDARRRPADDGDRHQRFRAATSKSFWASRRPPAEPNRQSFA